MIKIKIKLSMGNYLLTVFDCFCPFAMRKVESFCIASSILIVSWLAYSGVFDAYGYFGFPPINLTTIHVIRAVNLVICSLSYIALSFAHSNLRSAKFM